MLGKEFQAEVIITLGACIRKGLLFARKSGLYMGDNKNYYLFAIVVIAQLSGKRTISSLLALDVKGQAITCRGGNSIPTLGETWGAFHARASLHCWSEAYGVD